MNVVSKYKMTHSYGQLESYHDVAHVVSLPVCPSVCPSVCTSVSPLARLPTVLMLEMLNVIFSLGIPCHPRDPNGGVVYSGFFFFRGYVSNLPMI
jgi:hypothetical protein